MKITVVGSNGMAGHMITNYLKRCGHTVTAINRTQLDVEKHSVDSFFDLLDTDFLINAVGLLVKDCLNRPDRAAVINS